MSAITMNGVRASTLCFGELVERHVSFTNAAQPSSGRIHTGGILTAIQGFSLHANYRNTLNITQRTPANL